MTIKFDQIDRVEVGRLVDHGNRKGSAGYRTPYQVGIPNLIEATRVLAGRGFVDGQIAYHLGTSRRQIQRWRAYGEIPAALPNTGECRLLRTDLPNLPSDTYGHRNRRKCEKSAKRRAEAVTEEERAAARHTRVRWLYAS